MKRLIAALGVDVVQWRALTRALLTIDFAPLLRAVRGDDGLVAAAKAIGGMAVIAVLMSLFGIVPAWVLWTNDDLWLGGAVLSTQVMCFTAVMLLMNHAGALVMPQDHGVLGFRPITSRTYFAVRITTLFGHTLPFIAMISWLPLLGLTVRPDATLLLTTAGVAVVAITTVVTTLTLVSAYGWLLRLAGPRRFALLLNFAQIVSSFVAFSGFVVFMDDDARGFLQGGQLPRAWLTLIYPGAWFGSLLELASGAGSTLALTAAAMALVFSTAIAVSIGGKLSLQYASRLAQLLEASESRTRSVWVPRGFRDETRATAILVRSQFRNDFRFRMGVLAILPITIVYLVIGWRMGDMPNDPFFKPDPGGTMMIQMAVFFLPDTLRQALVQSDAYRASWIFHTTAADLTRLVVSSQIVIAALFIVPYSALLAVAFAFIFGHPGHAIVHALFLAWMSYVVLQLNVLIDPRLPFSRPPAQQAGLGSGLGLRFIVMIGGTFVYMFTTLVIYRVPLLLLATFAGMFAITMALNNLTRQRVEAKAWGLRYEG